MYITGEKQIITRKQTDLLFRGDKTGLYIEDFTQVEIVVIALLDYLGKDFLTLLENNYNTKITGQLRTMIDAHFEIKN